MKKTIKNNRKNRKMLQMKFRNKIRQTCSKVAYDSIIRNLHLDKKVARGVFLPIPKIPLSQKGIVSLIEEDLENEAWRIQKFN